MTRDLLVGMRVVFVLSSLHRNHTKPSKVKARIRKPNLDFLMESNAVTYNRPVGKRELFAGFDS